MLLLAGLFFVIATCAKDSENNLVFNTTLSTNYAFKSL